MHPRTLPRRKHPLRPPASNHDEVVVVEVIEVLADLGDNAFSRDRRAVAVIEEQPGGCIVDDVMVGGLGLLADMELIGAKRPLVEAFESLGIENDLVVPL